MIRFAGTVGNCGVWLAGAGGEVVWVGLVIKNLTCSTMYGSPATVENRSTAKITKGIVRAISR